MTTIKCTFVLYVPSAQSVLYVPGVLSVLIVTGNQYWQYDHYSNTLRHGASRRCLAINAKKDKLTMEECNSEQPRQRWRFQTYNPSKVDKNADDDEEEDS